MPIDLVKFYTYFFYPHQKKMEMLNNLLTDEFESLKRVYDTDSPDLIQTKKELDFLLKHNHKTPKCLDDILVN